VNTRGDDRWDEDPDDPVARFFARERADVRSEPADDLHWQRIVREAYRPRGRRWLGYAGGVAAAGLVGAVAGVAIFTGGRFAGPDVTAATSGPSQTQQRAATGSPTGGETATGAPQPSPSETESALPPPPPLRGRPVPASFTATSLSNSGGGNLYALGSSDCGDQRCPTLVGSQDNGDAWHTVHVFDAAALPNPTGSLGRLPSPDSLGQVRFANPTTGWVYGGDVLLTRDGGRTWHPYPHPGDTVLDLETDGDDVALVAADGCGDQGLCQGSLRVGRASVTAAGMDRTAATESRNAVIVGAQVEVQRGQVWLETQWLPRPAPPTGAAQLVDGVLQPLGTPPGCARMPRAVAPSAVAAGDPTLFALCGGPENWQVQSSDDDGATWEVQGDGLVLPRSDQVSLAASDDRHVVAASPTQTSHGTHQTIPLLVSDDGGRSWHEPARPPRSEDGWAWVGAPGGSQFYAVSGADGSYWHSVDDGEHWTRVSFVDGAQGGS
jgi:photosystem II stability/assembly factor-like uncharacterized protein